jgi:single-strand DNA-binding protein
MALPHTTLTGNLTEDPELRFTATGTALTKLRVACSERKKDQQTGQWSDGKTTFLDVVAWRDLAETAAANLSKGDKITVVGKLTMNAYTDKAGIERISYEINADTIAAPLGALSRQPSAPSTQPTLTDEEPF